MKPLPYWSESRVIEMVLSFFSKILLQTAKSLAHAPFRSSAFAAGLAIETAIKTENPIFGRFILIDCLLMRKYLNIGLWRLDLTPVFGSSMLICIKATGSGLSGPK